MNHSGGLGSSVGIATDYGLDGLGSSPGRDELFCPSRPALPTLNEDHVTVQRDLLSVEQEWSKSKLV